MLAAESLFKNHMYPTGRSELTSYEDSVKASWVYSDLKAVRNVKPSAKYGFLPMMAHSAFSCYIGGEPWTIKNKTTDSEVTLGLFYK
jgi:electron-transferring-flavoprotein dehydrogenase